MSQRAVELALKRQRLQFVAAGQREAMARNVAGLQPLFAAADSVHAGFLWLKRHPEWVIGGVVLIVVAKPRQVLRVARRAFYTWQVARRLRRFVDDSVREARRDAA